MASPGVIRPPCRTMAMMPALAVALSSGVWVMQADMRPGWRSLSCWQGLRRPVTSMRASGPMASRVPVGRLRRSMLAVVMFSPIWPGWMVKPEALSSAMSSEWMRWTWRRLGWVGSLRMRLRCLTVTPRWESPSTPRAVMRRMLGWVGLLKV